MPKSRPLRQEHYRWMREGTPNFNDKVFQYISELEIIAKKDVKWVYSSTPIMKVIEEMAHSYRSLVVLSQSGLFSGLITAMRVVEYLGGGDLFEIVAKRHYYNIFSALNKEPVENIMVKNPVVVYVDEGIKEALSRMITYGAGVIPVLERNGKIYGILTEHDLVKYLAGVVSIGLKIKEAMSTPVVTIAENSTLREAMEKMVKFGFRRLPVVDREGMISGLITAIDIVREFGTHNIVRRINSEDIRDILTLPVSEIMVKDVAVVHMDDDLADAVGTMLSKNISSVLVIDDEGALKGIVTERDVLYAIVAPK
ncbi:MAG: CBS domain-containing protein [Desulfurococcaceae archaeon]